MGGRWLVLNLRTWGGWVAGSKCVGPGRPGGKLLGSPQVTGGGEYCAELDLREAIAEDSEREEETGQDPKGL